MIEQPRDDIATDLVEYLVLVVPGPDALASVGPELAHVLDSSAIRILDVVVVAVDEHGLANVIEADSVESLAVVWDASPCVGALLSRHDIGLVSMVLEPDSAAIIVVVEDRWAGPLSAAVRAVGGEVLAGERIERQRVEAAFARAIEVAGER